MNVSKRISRGMILNGLRNGSIKVINDEDGLKAQIGEYWFYFGCADGEEFDEERNDIIHNIIIITINTKILISINLFL